MDSLSVLAMAAAAAPRSQVPQPKAEFTIRRARNDDLPLLGPVERSAAELFRTVNLDFLADGPTVDESLLSAMMSSNHLWIAVNETDQPIGFAGGEGLDGNFHIAEVSVGQDAQGKGVGKALMEELIRQAKEEGYMAITLTTYRDLPWNGPWYRKLGFLEVQVDEMGDEYAKIWNSEAQHGHEMGLRCVMRKILSSIEQPPT
jgi:GNAT superfamily N-acetyltransferase